MGGQLQGELAGGGDCQALQLVQGVLQQQIQNHLVCQLVLALHLQWDSAYCITVAHRYCDLQCDQVETLSEQQQQQLARYLNKQI